jgi:hypothetical protein
MQFTVEYDDGVWLFTVTSGDSDDDYLEEFEITNVEDAAAAAADLVKEIMEIAEGEDDLDEDADPLEGFVKDLDK